MKELYIAPELELLCLTAEERLATDLGVDFGEMLGGPEKGESVMPEVDIEVLL